LSPDSDFPSVFVCGPITHALGDGCFDPRLKDIFERVTRRLEQEGFTILSAHRMEAYGEKIPKSPEEVFRRDWHLAQRCSAMVMVFPSGADGTLFRTDGTFIELGWAVALNKPLFVVTDPAATGRSYLFDGLLGTQACLRVFTPAQALQGDELVAALRGALFGRRAAPGAREVTFCCTSFGFGPVSKVVSVAEAIRQLRPEYRLTFLGSDIAESYVRGSGVFDAVVPVNVDTHPEACAAHARESNALVNGLNFGVLSAWDRHLPPQFFLDSLAWMWPSIPDAVERARTYFVQEYLLAASTSGGRFPANTERVPPIVSPSLCQRRAAWEAQRGYLLVNLAGCRNPFFPPDYYERYVTRMLQGLAAALERIARGGQRAITRVVVCGNQELLDAARGADWSGVPVRVEQRFLPPREFLLELRRCELFLTSPGLTATLEALALGVPCRFLLPQNYSQFRILSHYRSLGLERALWPDAFVSERLRDPALPEEDGVREVGRLMNAYLDSGVETLADAFEALFALDPSDEESAVLSRRVVAWDGAMRVAEHVVREIEAAAVPVHAPGALEHISPAALPAV